MQNLPPWRAPVEAARWRPIPWQVVDTVVAAVLTVATLAPSLGLTASWNAPIPWWAYPLAAATTVPLLWRRRHPLLVATVVGAASAAYSIAVLPDPPVPFGALVAFMSLAAYAERRYALLALPVAGITVPAVEYFSDATRSDYVWVLILLASAWLYGDASRNRREYAAAMAERAERLAGEREAQVAAAAAAERTRIARELHDVLGHSVSLMVVQAEAGAVTALTDPTAAGQAFEAISATGREALGELRRLVGVLRQPGETTGRSPQPGLPEVADLVERARQAGLPVTVTTEGDPLPLSAGLSLTVYRVIQQALTNTAQHTRGARIDVAVRYGPDQLTVRVHDRGGRPPAQSRQGAGVGLTGLRERAALYAGTLRAGPDEDGWTVEARFPLVSQSSTTGTLSAS